MGPQRHWNVNFTWRTDDRVNVYRTSALYLLMDTEQPLHDMPFRHRVRKMSNPPRPSHPNAVRRESAILLPIRMGLLCDP